MQFALIVFFGLNSKIYYFGRIYNNIPVIIWLDTVNIEFS